MAYTSLELNAACLDLLLVSSANTLRFSLLRYHVPRDKTNQWLKINQRKVVDSLLQYSNFGCRDQMLQRHNQSKCLVAAAAENHRGVILQAAQIKKIMRPELSSLHAWLSNVQALPSQGSG